MSNSKLLIAALQLQQNVSNAVKIYLLHTNIHKHTHIYIYILYTYIYIYIYILEDILIIYNMNSYNYGCYEAIFSFHLRFQFVSFQKVFECRIIIILQFCHQTFHVAAAEFPSHSTHTDQYQLTVCCPTYPLEKEFQRQDGNLPFNMEITTFFIAIFYPKIRGKPGGKFTAVNVNYRGKRQIIQ